MGHGINSLPCSYSNDVIDLFPKQLWRHTDFEVMSSGCHSVKVLSTTVGCSLVAMVRDLCFHVSYDSIEAWHTAYAMLLSNYK